MVQDRNQGGGSERADIVARGDEIFSLKFMEYRLAAGFCPDLLGELKRSPRPSSRNKGDYF